MEATKKAIQIGIEAGIYGNPEKLKDVDWFIKDDLIFWNRDGKDGISISLHKQFLRPEFWQALGKSLGWVETKINAVEVIGWKIKWHDFIDHLAENKPINDFFKDLLANPSDT